ncbi:hypothetical protein BC939DRAFT_525334 [Gamsiella multidivaricata]|uniref:uncharacterized protein n=1 Tax=Gamsiella multidivaricata TaxID=101098 RepID=UPI00221E489F|nr:uncharacterized protein BC939DRAFT_525334 [Gamsiella multidivaricata]KAI7831308.1 hypothetical protein BC939DRAFT_525334 [Gamsiella multidivaricata]
MSEHTSADKPVPMVLIVGAGLGGLTLAMLLERINIPYHIFERATELKPLGISAMALAGNILPIFEQLGLYEDLMQISHPYPEMDLYNANLKKLGSMSLMGHKIATGYDYRLLSRPKLYELLLRQVPADKISLKKRILRTEEKDDRVHIYCADNTTYEGDVLVGADGAYSGVRQSLYKRLDEQGILPKKDLENFSIAYSTIVGVAEPKDLEKYSQLKEKHSFFSQALDQSNRNWYVINVPNNQICWGVGVQLTQEQAKGQHFRNSEWGPEANEAMMKEFQDLPCPWGGKMGDIFDATPKNLISKVYLEEKMFKTWHYGRTVLLGDACHKMLPGAGQGAINAMQDAIIIANGIYNMKDTSRGSITALFEDYYRQRYHHVEERFKNSALMSKIMHGQAWTERLLRHVVLNYLPYWMLKEQFAKDFEYRPQIAWLPLIKNRGTGNVLPQEGRRKKFAAEAATV